MSSDFVTRDRGTRPTQSVYTIRVTVTRSPWGKYLHSWQVVKL